MSAIGDIWRQLLGLAISSICVFSANCASSQITPDRTLPNNTTVTINGSVFNIIGGTQAGRNLFHSFQQFSVPTGSTASFNNGLDIQNIFSRVTGGTISNIDGIIKTNGTANLFFLNSNGIVFGKNASLNIGGSFVATTANAIQFGNLGTFSASVPNSPALLTVNPSALLYNQINAGASIQNNAQYDLQVPQGHSLLLAGGDINMNGGGLLVFNGQVELGGLKGTGTIGLQTNNNNLRLSYPDGVARGDVSLINGSEVSVTGNGGGIAVNARNFNITGGSSVDTLAQVSGNISTRASDIDINASDTVTIDGSGPISLISAITSHLLGSSGLTGNGSAGNIFIKTGSLKIIGNVLISSDTFGQGNAGNVTIQATDAVDISGHSNVESSAALGVGNAGDISIQAKSLSLSDGASLGTTSDFGTGNAGNIQINVADGISVNRGSFVQADTFGQGNAGNIKINAGGTVSLDGSEVLAQVEKAAPGFVIKGKGGDISINANSILLTNAAEVSTSTYGQGNAGNVIINATKNISLDGSNTLVSSRVQTTGVGNAGNIQVNTGQLSLSNGAQLIASTLGQGNAGDVIINATKSVSLDGGFTNSNGNSVLSGIFSRVGSPTNAPNNFVKGNGGNIQITTEGFSLTNGAQLVADTYGKGNAGNVIINATKRVSLDGGFTNSNGNSVLSGIFSRVESTGIGKAGNIQITTDQLSLTKGAGLIASTNGQGNAGDVIINATNSVSLDGNNTGVFSRVESTGVGNAGNIQITTDQLSLTKGAGLIATTDGQGNAGNISLNANSLSLANSANVQAVTFGQGNAGNLDIKAGSVRLDNNASLNVETISGQGNITIHSQDLILLSRGSNITANASGTDVIGGNIKINTDVLGAVEKSKISADSIDFRGGQVKINAQGIFLSSDSTITARGVNQQLNGTVQINTPDIDPTRGLIILPTITENPPKLVSSSCSAFNETNGGNNFTITGRGGLPPNPYEPLTSDAIWSDTRLPLTTAHQNQPKKHGAKIKPKPVEIVPATGWVFNGKGEVTLISSVSNTTSSTPTSCPAR